MFGRKLGSTLGVCEVIRKNLSLTLHSGTARIAVRLKKRGEEKGEKKLPLNRVRSPGEGEGERRGREEHLIFVRAEGTEGHSGFTFFSRS